MWLPPESGLRNKETMFSGIITNKAKVLNSLKTKDGLSISLKKPAGWVDLALGESISVNGVCLTVTEITKKDFSLDLTPETLKKTTFGIQVPDHVNLERSLSLGDRLGGHFVFGHVDDIGSVAKANKSLDNGVRLNIKFGSRYKNWLVDKGSVSINGASLTVVKTSSDAFSIALVPYTLKHTTLGDLKEGEKVNLEFDLIGKYVAKIVGKYDK